MDVDLVIGVLQSVSGLKSPRLIVSAIRARDELPEGIVTWEPGFQVVLLGCCIVELSRHDIDDLVRQSEALVKQLRSLDHFLELVPRLVGLTVDELLDLLELVDSEDTPDVSTVRASLLTEAGRDTCVPLGQISWLDPLLHMHGRNRLFRSGNEIERLIVVGALNLVQVFSEVRQLTGVLHDALLHEIGRLHLSVIILVQLGKAVVDQSLIEHDSEAF